MKRIHIDTMAPYGVTSTPSAIVRVQEMHPNISLTGVSGSIPIAAIVTIGFHVKRKSSDDRWMYLEIPRTVSMRRLRRLSSILSSTALRC